MEHKYSDWSDDDLSRHINERRGCYASQKKGKWQLITPQNAIADLDGLLAYPYDFEHEAWRQAPDPTRNLNDAYTLLNNRQFHDVVISRRGYSGWFCRINEVHVYNNFPDPDGCRGA